MHTINRVITSEYPRITIDPGQYQSPYHLNTHELPVADITLRAHAHLNLVFNFPHDPIHACIYRLHLKNHARFTGYLEINSGTHHITIELYLHESCASALVYGTYQLRHQESITIITHQHHYAPRTTSTIYLKGALHDKSQSLYKGMIYVEKCAQQSQAQQKIKNLLLGTHTKAQTLPHMKVLTNNVSCSHGAAIGNLDKNQIYYAQSRGISIEKAHLLLVEAFLSSTRF